MAALRSVRMSPNRFEATMHVERLGPTNEIHAGGVDQQRLGSNVRIVARDLGEDAIPERHAEALRVRLGHRRQPALAVPRWRARSNANRITRSVP